MYTVQKAIEVSCAHRLEGHVKCSRLHGHNYLIVATVKGTTLDEAGMLIDFGDLKTLLREVHDEIDHKYIVSQENIRSICPYYDAAVADAREDEIVVLSIPTSTAENIAKWVLSYLDRRLPAFVKVSHVEVHETMSSVAQAWRE